MSLFSTKQMRGLKNFITECLDCRSKEEEKGRVTKELANIRKHFAQSTLNGYNRKKYVAKLLYIHLLGYSFEFGFTQMVELLTSNVFSEKQIGYITLGVYLNGNYELVSLLIEHIRKEMNSDNEAAQCLGLAAAANIGGTEIAETLAPTIMNMLKNGRNGEFVKKKAALALVRLYRETPSTFVYDESVGRVLISLLQDTSFGVQLSGASLVLVLMVRYANDLQKVFPIAIDMLSKIFFQFQVPMDYTYGRNPVPWLVMKYMRILQYKTQWKNDDIAKVSRVIDLCLQKTDLLLGTKEVNSNMMLLFEAINLVIATQMNSQLLSRSAAILGGFLSAKQSNVRYLALETLTRLVSAAPEVIPSLDKHRQTLFLALRDADNSIRRRALSLLYVLCTPESAEEIVSELLNYLKFADISMREPLCLKIAVLAESFMTDLAWYVDTILQLITLAGDECHDGVWHRVVQVISMNPQYQRYATVTSFNSMTASTAHDRLVKLAAQLSGDYFHLLPNPPEEVVDELKKKYPGASDGCKSIIISAIAKIGARYQAGRELTLNFLKKLCGNQNIDIQQRALEYCAILQGPPDIIPIVFKPIPPFEERESFLIRKVLQEDMGAQHGTGEEEEEDKGEPDEEALATVLPVRSAQPTQQESFQAVPSRAPQPEPVQQQPPAQQPQQGWGYQGAPAPTPTPAPAPAPAPQASSLTDLMSMAPAPTESAGDDLIKVMGAGPVAPASAEAIFKRFLTTDTGIAFEDQNIQLMLSIQVNGANALLTFNVQNKTPQPISGLKIHVLPVPFFRMNVKPGPSVVNAGASVLYQFMFTVVAPYTEPPQYTFGYMSGSNEVKETMKLPLVICKFMMPFPMDQGTFFTRWQQLAAPNQTAKASCPVPQGDITQQLAAMMTSLLRVPVLPLQLPPFNVCGAGIVQCEGSAQGILVRFFADQQTQSVQIEVKGTSPSITSSIQKILEWQFK